MSEADIDFDRFPELLHAAPTAMLVIDRELRMAYANPAYLGLVGLSLDQLAGRLVFDVFPDDPADEGPSQAAALLEIMHRALRLAEPQVLVEYPYDIPNSEGGFDRRFWNVSEVPILDAAGRAEFILHTTEDVTAVVEARLARERADVVAEELRVRVAATQETLKERAAELEVLNDRLEVIAQRDRSIAEILQDALLTELPSTPEMPICGVYRSAADRVGGDWYDAIKSGSSTTVMIGDVIGHDMIAAAAMGQFKSMLRLLSLTCTSPAQTLTELDTAVERLDLQAMATILMATIDEQPADQGADCFTVTWSSAGHPPPVLVEPDGVVRLLDIKPDIFIGAGPGAQRRDTRTDLPRGAKLLLYTDGLVERRGESIDAGFDRLVETVRGFARDDVEKWPDRLIENMVGSHNTDDIALLLVENPER